MNAITRNSEHEFVEKKSKFIARSFIVSSESEAMSAFEKVSSQFRDATHNIYAYRILENGVLKIKFSDAGEPKNTAGKPIVDLLSRLDLINTLIVVTRYFGGIKLGAPGLLRAYLGSAKHVIDASKIEEYTPRYTIEISFGYNLISQIDNLLKDRKHASVLDKAFTEEVNYKISADKETIDLLKNQWGVKFRIANE
jgi:uncharacterized YigZ family protein